MTQFMRKQQKMFREDYTHNTKQSACDHLADDEEFVRRLVQETLNEVLESEMTEFLGAGKSERTQTRQGYRSGYYRRDLTMKVGGIELRVPQERSGQFSTRVFERYQRSEKALVAVLSEMYVQGVSTRRVSRLAEDLCGHEFSPATISAMVSKLDASLKAFADRRLEEAYPYVLLDARYEKVREEGSVRSRAVQIAIGIDGEGRRQVLAAEVANRESEGSWTEFLSHLKEHVELCQESSAISSGSGDPPIWAGLRSARNFRASHAASRHASDSGSDARTTPIRPYR